MDEILTMASYRAGNDFRTDLELAEELFDLATGEQQCGSAACHAEWGTVAAIAAELAKRARS